MKTNFYHVDRHEKKTKKKTGTATYFSHNVKVRMRIYKWIKLKVAFAGLCWQIKKTINFSKEKNNIAFSFV